MKTHIIIVSLFLSALLFTSCMDSTSSEFDDYDNTQDLEFLEENAQREDVMVTDSGLQYRVIEDSTGVSPTDETAVVMHYTMSLVDGTELANTYEFERPQMYSVNQLIAGLREGLQIMNVGAIYELVLPAELAFGDDPPQGIPPGATLIYEMELIHDNSLDTQFLAENLQRDDVEVTSSGLQYRIIEEGDGISPDADDIVQIHYKGVFIYGDEFDSSQNNAPAEFRVNELIQGFSEGIQLMEEGSTYELFIPADLAYGDEPPQGMYAGATLIFEVELVNVF